MDDRGFQQNILETPEQATSKGAESLQMKRNPAWALAGQGYERTSDSCAINDVVAKQRANFAATSDLKMDLKSSCSVQLAHSLSISKV